MSTRSRIVVNPGSGQRRVALSATCDRITVLGAGQGAREERVQPCAEQRLTVRRGRMAVVCDGALSILEAGESIAIAPGVPHAWWSTRAGELCVEIDADPEAFALPHPSPRRGRRVSVASGARRLTVRIAS